VRYSDHEPDSVDWLDLGPDPDEGRKPADPRRRYLFYGAAAGLVVVALLVARTQQGTDQAATSPSTPSRASTPSSPSATVSSSPASSRSFVDPPPTWVTLPAAGQSAGLTEVPSAGPPQVTNVGHPLLDVPTNWELFALGSGVVVRIQLALGRITTTPVPVSRSDVPAMFLVGSDRVLVRPADEAGGYVVRDGKRPADLPASLKRGYFLLPSRDQRHLWTSNSDGVPGLVNLDGKPTGVTIDMPANGSVQGSDGGGYLLVTSIDGVYDARPGSVHRITTGPLLASGPTGWLAVECDDNLSCATVAIDRATRARHRLDTPFNYGDSYIGIISPDGRTAALLAPSDGISASGIHLLDLDSGAVRSVEVTSQATSNPVDPQWAWSPDSRWLFVIDAGRRVMIINRATGQVTPLGTRLAGITQLALRHGAS